MANPGLAIVLHTKDRMRRVNAAKTNAFSVVSGLLLAKCLHHTSLKLFRMGSHIKKAIAE